MTRKTKNLRLFIPISTALLLLMLILALPRPALSTPFTYTYTGKTFSRIYGSEWTTADYLTITITLDHGSGPGSFTESYTDPRGITVPYVMSAGNDTIKVPTGPQLNEDQFTLRWDAKGAVLSWGLIEAHSFYNPYHPNPHGGFAFESSGGPPPNPNGDQVVAYDNGSVANSFTSGTWTVSPEPATMLLLGSGLIGLAGYGRKKFFKK